MNAISNMYTFNNQYLNLPDTLIELDANGKFLFKGRPISVRTILPEPFSKLIISAYQNMQCDL